MLGYNSKDVKCYLHVDSRGGSYNILNCPKCCDIMTLSCEAQSS